MFKLPYKVRWENSAFLITTFVTTITVVPVYLWHNGLDWFQKAKRGQSYNFNILRIKRQEDPS